MTNRPKALGTAVESAVVAHARRNGFGGADRLTLSGTADRGDVRLTAGLTAGVVVECKGGTTAERASDALIASWLDETERERVNAGAAVALLVTKRKGYGAARAGSWWAHARLGTVCYLTSSLADVSLTLAQRAALYGLPVRLTLDDALHLLRSAGYGDPLEVTR